MKITKRLIICCDGTWNAPEINDPKCCRPTNVLKLCRAVDPEPSQDEVQIVLYVPGIGTHDVFERYVGGMTGWGISRNIQDAYQFLVNNYRPGNEIYLFGFSRGAYTARSLSGFIEKAGLIRKEYMHLFPGAYQAYRERAWDKFHEKNPNITHLPPSEVRIQMLGVWDTVGSLGAPTPLLRRATRKYVSFHTPELASNVTHAYQALALHEVRAHFKPALWMDKKDARQTVEQVWFQGAHSDVGGGLPSSGLSDIALDWMMTRAAALGLKFDGAYRQQFVAPRSDTDIDISLRGKYWPFPAYVRPIGEKHLDKIKPKSLEEYQHGSVASRLDVTWDWHWLRDWRKKRYFEKVRERARTLSLLPEDLAILNEKIKLEKLREQQAEEERQAHQMAELVSKRQELLKKGSPGIVLKKREDKTP